MKRIIAFLLLALLLAGAFPSAALAGWEYKDDIWYYLNSDGSPYDGWLNDGGSWYYIVNGRMARGHCRIIDGAEYYLDDSGKMRTGWVYIFDGWRYYAPNGQRVSGWIFDGGSWYNLNQYGRLATGWLYLSDNEHYYFTESGRMVTGWAYINDGWYYFDASGKAHTGWLLDGGAWYYFDDYGHMISGRIIQLDGKCYAFAETGEMVTGWYKDGDKWTYLNADGTTPVGWVFFEDAWYYFHPGYVSDASVSYPCYLFTDGGCTIDGSRYFFDADGRMLSDAWVRWRSLRLKNEDAWFYFDPDGKAHEGWLWYDGYWYYCSDGEMATGGWGIDNQILVFDENGHYLG